MVSTVDQHYAAQFVSDIFNQQNAIAVDRLNKSDSLTSQALGVLGSTPDIHPESAITTAGLMPLEPVLPSIGNSDFSTVYTGVAAEMAAMIGEGLTKFYQDFFPLGSELAAARTWIERMLSTGGTGLNPHIENQIWERDRARILKDANRASSEVIASFSARGFPMPSGAMYARINTLDEDARDKIAQSSRDVAIKQAEIEVENIRFAIGKALEFRVSAVQSAGDYIKTIALGPQMGVQLASAIADAKTKMSGALVNFYQAQTAAAEIPLKIKIANASNDLEAKRVSLGARIQTMQSRVNVVEAAARAAGTQAAAALNAVNASTGYSFSGSGQDSRTVIENI